MRCSRCPRPGSASCAADQDTPGAFHALPQVGTKHVPDDHHQGQLPVADPPAGVPGLPRLPPLRRRRERGGGAALPRPVLLQRLLRECQPGAGDPAEGGRRPGATPATTSTATAARPSSTCSTPTRATSCSRPRGPSWPPVVEKIAHLKERRQVRMFVRRDPYGRYLSCLVYLPRDRYTTAVRQRMEDAAAAPAGRRLDRLHRAGLGVGARPAALRPPDAGGGVDGRGRRPGARAGADPGHPVLERRVRRSDRRLARRRASSRPWWARCPRATRRTTRRGRPRWTWPR